MPPVPDPVKTFRRLADAWLRETCERFPEYGSELGYSRYEARLGANTSADRAAQLRLCRDTLAAVEALPDLRFRGDDYLDRRGFLSMLRTHLLIDGTFERGRNNPQGSIDAAIQSVFSLLLRHTRNLKKALPAIEARLDAIPLFLKNGAAGVRYPVPLWTHLAAKSCEGGIEFFEGIIDELCRQSPHPDETLTRIHRVCDSIRRYRDAIEKKPPGAKNGFSLGRDAFEVLLRERLGIDRSLPEIEADGWDLIRSLEREIAVEAKRLGYDSAEAALAAGPESWTPERPLIDEYRETTNRIRDRLVELDLVTMPRGESLDVLPVPAFLRHQFPTAAYSQPPAFSRQQRGIFWVNDLSLLESDPARRLAEVRQHYGIELTAAHEAYPGHHLQFAIQNRHPSKIRRLFAHAIFYEGWTLWCEKMCVDQQLVDLPAVRLRQLHDALWRAYRIVIDCGLHGGTLSYDGACRLLMRGVGFTRARAEGDVNWYSSAPTVPMSYLLGRLEVEKLHARFAGVEGWSLKQFNDWMLSHGALPWSWILEARLRG